MARTETPAWTYETYQVPAIFEPWARILIELSAPHTGEHVLDAACGTGINARLIARLVGPSGRVVGVDFDPAMLAVGKELAPDIEWVEGDLQRLAFADGQFDLVICQQGLQFLPDRLAGLRQIHRVLRPGGRAAFAIWTTLDKSPGQAALFGALGAMLGTDMSRPPAWSLGNGEQVETLMSAAGFAPVEMTTHSMTAIYPSARGFVEAILNGASKLTRQALDRLPADRRAAFIEEVAGDLRAYETPAGLELPHESRLIVAHKEP